MDASQENTLQLEPALFLERGQQLLRLSNWLEKLRIEKGGHQAIQMREATGKKRPSTSKTSHTITGRPRAMSTPGNQPLFTSRLVTVTTVGAKNGKVDGIRAMARHNDVGIFNMSPSVVGDTG